MATSHQTPDGHDIRSGRQAMGRRLQNARREARLTQNAVAARLEVTPQTIRNWESGRHQPPQRLRQPLADLYGITRAELIGQDETDHLGSLMPYSRVDVAPARLKLGRERAGLSRWDTAERSGISHATIGRYERGSISPTKANLETLAALYGRPTRWFLRQERTRRTQTGTNNKKGGSTTVRPYDDEVTEAYGMAQPDLTSESIRSIADYIRFLHDQELRHAE